MTDHDCAGSFFCPDCPRCPLCGFRIHHHPGGVDCATAVVRVEERP